MHKSALADRGRPANGLVQPDAIETVLSFEARMRAVGRFT